MDFTEIMEELEIKVKLPMRLKIQAYSFLNKNPTETQGIVIEDLSVMDSEIFFNSLTINFPPQLIYDIQYSKSFCIIFVFNLGIGKEQHEIGKIFLIFL